MVCAACVYFEGVARCAWRVCSRRCLVCASPSLIDSQFHAAGIRLSIFEREARRRVASRLRRGTQARSCCGLSFNYSSRQLPNPCAITNHMSARLSGATDSQCSPRCEPRLRLATRRATRAVLLIARRRCCRRSKRTVSCTPISSSKQSLFLRHSCLAPRRAAANSSAPNFSHVKPDFLDRFSHSHSTLMPAAAAVAPQRTSTLRLRRRHCCSHEARWVRPPQ